jgi:hypothetical protein
MKKNEQKKFREEDPLELTRRLRRELMSDFDNDLGKVFDFLKTEREKNPNQYIDVKNLPKK